MGDYRGRPRLDLHLASRRILSLKLAMTPSQKLLADIHQKQAERDRLLRELDPMLEAA